MGEEYAYLGPAGTFTEIAALKYCADSQQLLPLKTINEVFIKVNEAVVKNGIIPMENSLEGSVNLSLDLLFREKEIQIIAEIVVPIEHYLYAYPGTKIEAITEILSHPQAIAQSYNFIVNKLPNAQITYTNSTAAAAEIIVESKSQAMIGSKRIAQLYNLELLAENIEDDRDNQTRFAVIAQAKPNLEFPIAKDYKTSVVFAPVENRVGVLVELLNEFSKRRINLTKIESRPTKKKFGEYLFYVDLAGHQNQKIIREALKEVQKKSGLFKILGSYRKYNS